MFSLCPPPGGGTPLLARSGQGGYPGGVPPWPGQMEYLIRRGRYASCARAGGLPYIKLCYSDYSTGYGTCCCMKCSFSQGDRYSANAKSFQDLSETRWYCKGEICRGCCYGRRQQGQEGKGKACSCRYVLFCTSFHHILKIILFLHFT